MTKIQRNIGIGVAAFILLLLVLPQLINVNSFRPKIESELGSALGRKVELGNLSLSILGGSVSAANIRIADDPAFSRAPFLTAKSLRIGVELMPLIFSKQLNITSMTLNDPSIALLRGPNDKWNFSSLVGGSSKPAPTSSRASPSKLSIKELRVSDGKLIVGKVNSPAKPLTIDDVSIEVKHFSSTSQFPFELSASLPGSGRLSVEGKAGPLGPAGVPVQASLKIQKLDLATLAADPSMGLAGIGNLDSKLDSDGKIAKVSGTLSLSKLKLSPKGTPAGRPIEVKLAFNHNLSRQAGTLSQGDVVIGKAVAHLTGSYQAVGDATVANLKLNAPGLPVDEVEAMLPVLGVTLPAGASLKGGTLSAALAMTGPTDKLVVEGPVKLENSKLEGFDLGSKLSVLSAFSGKAAPSGDTIIQNASTTARVAPNGTTLNAIDVAVASLGVLTGSGTVSASGALNFKMVAELSGRTDEGVGQRSARREGRSREGIPFVIEGTTANPKFVPDVGGMASGAIQQAITGKIKPEGEDVSKGLGGLLKKRF